MKKNIIKISHSISPFIGKKIISVDDVITKETYNNSMTENTKKIDDRKN